jgi:hypothetical protein
MSAGRDTKKLVFLLLVSFVASGSVVYQIRARRAAVVRPPAAVQPAEPVGPLVATPGAAISSETSGAPGAQLSDGVNRTEVPPDVWSRGGRRNPFLSVEEAANLDRPPSIATTEESVPAPPIQQPAELPAYSVTAIIAGQQGKRAIVGTRVLQPGDQLGRETVKEITERSVVLEYEGRTRELILRRLQDDIRQSLVPRGE